METRFAVPYVSSITWQLNKINMQDVVQTNAGPRQAFYAQDPYMSFDVTSYIAGREVGTITYNFPKTLKEDQEGVTVAELLAGSTTDVLALWSQTILDQMSNSFPGLADQDPQYQAIGTPHYLRLDAIKVILPYSNNKAVTATIGVYLDDKFTQPTKYLELVFADGDTLRARESEKTQLDHVFANNEAVIANAESTPEQKAQAVQQNQQITKRLQEMEFQLVADLETLLGKNEVKLGAKEVVKLLFVKLKAVDPRWKDINVDALLALFALPDVS